MRVTQKGQVTIPHKLRERYGIGEQTVVVFEPVADGILIKPAANERVARLRSAVRMARGRADAGLSTDSIMNTTRGES